jgi:hypothetical protein
MVRDADASVAVVDTFGGAESFVDSTFLCGLGVAGSVSQFAGSHSFEEFVRSESEGFGFSYRSVWRAACGVE